MPGSPNRRAVQWLRAQLPELVARGVITEESAKAINRHYGSAQSRSNFGFVLLATIGAALVGAGIILLIAHNWDELGRATRTVIAFIPLVVAQALVAFVLLRRNESRPWREAVAIFDFAAVATAISLVSQTYQISGSFADFMKVWLLLIVAIVYLLRSAFGSLLYVAGLIVWLFAREVAFLVRTPNPMFFWIGLLLVFPYFVLRYRKNRENRETAMLGIALVLALTFGVGFTTEFAKSDLGAVAFAGLFSAIYLAGMQFFPANGERLHMIALLGGIGVGVTAIVLSFESSWHMTRQFFWGDRTLAANIAFALEFLFPLAAIILAVWSFIRRRFQFSLAPAVFPLVTALALGLVNVCETPAAQYIYPTTCSFVAAGLMNGYVLWLGSDILIRGIRANSVARANFGLLLIAALALSRFFDSQLSFVTRGLGFIVVGAGFLIANILLFKKRSTAVAAA